MYRIQTQIELWIKPFRVFKDGETELKDKIKRLCEHPREVGRPTNMPIFGGFYLNISNNYSILFDVIEVDKIIKIHQVLHRARLHKILKGPRINQP